MSKVYCCPIALVDYCMQFLKKKVFDKFIIYHARGIIASKDKRSTILADSGGLSNNVINGQMSWTDERNYMQG